MIILCSTIASAQKNQDAQHVLDYVNDSIYYNLDESLNRINSALKQPIKNPGIKAKLLARKALILDIQGDFEECVGYYHQALELQNIVNDSGEISFIYNNMGVAYYDRYRTKEAVEFYLKSAKIDSALGLTEDYIASMQNVGVIYSSQNNLKAADSIYNAMIPIATSAGYKSILTPLYSNKTKIFILQGNLSDAEKSLALATRFLTYSQDPTSPLTLTILRGNIYLRQNKYKQALKLLNNDSIVSLASDFPERAIYIDELKSQLYFSSHSIDSAFYYYDRFLSRKDSLLNLETQSKVEEIRSKYKLVEKDKELVKAKVKDEQQRNEILKEKEKTASNKAQRNLLIALVAILAIVILFFVQRYRIKQNEKRILEDKIRAREELLELKESMMGEIHHRIKNNLQMVSSMLVLQGSFLDNNNAKQKFDDSRKRIESIAKIHEQLYTSSNYEYLDAQKFARDLCEQTLKISEYKIALTINPFGYKIHVDTLVPIALILNEWLTNSIKHAFDIHSHENQIQINFKLEGEKLIVEYSDNGKGLTPHTENGFGSMMVRSLCRQLKATLESNHQKGFYSCLEITKFKLDDEVYRHS